MVRPAGAGCRRRPVSAGIQKRRFSPTTMSCRPSVHPLMTRSSGNSAGYRASRSCRTSCRRSSSPCSAPCTVSSAAGCSVPVPFCRTLEARPGGRLLGIGGRGGHVGRRRQALGLLGGLGRGRRRGRRRRRLRRFLLAGRTGDEGHQHGGREVVHGRYFCRFPARCQQPRSGLVGGSRRITIPAMSLFQKPASTPAEVEANRPLELRPGRGGDLRREDLV